MRPRSLSPVDRMNKATEWIFLSKRTPEWKRLDTAYARWRQGLLHGMYDQTAPNGLLNLLAMVTTAERYTAIFDQFYWDYLDMRVRGDI
jgi:hypothetical protein